MTARNTIQQKGPIRFKEGTLCESKSFGPFVIVRYETSVSVVIRFVETGTVRTVKAQHIDSRSVADPFKPIVNGIGFLGDGRHNTRISAHGRWKSMLNRCYNEKYKYYEKGCAVDPKWHNYQTFADWYHHQCEILDINPEKNQHRVRLFDGNVLFGPKTAVLTYEKLATQQTLSFIGPDNEKVDVDNLVDFCGRNDLSIVRMRAVNDGTLWMHKGYTKA